MSPKNYLIWSNEHRAWWRANSQGYSTLIGGAGFYTRDEAIAIAGGSRDGWHLDRRPDEIAVALADIPAHIREAIAPTAVHEDRADGEIC